MKPVRVEEEGVTPCIVVGTGVAGHAAAVWLHAYGVPFKWLGSRPVGGMLHRVHNKLVNVPGADFAHGGELSAGMQAQVDAAAFPAPTSAHITRITADGPHKLKLHGPHHTDQARVVILATGTHYRTLSLLDAHSSPLLTHEDAAILSHSASQDAQKFTDREVAVIGGGDAAFENALILARHASRVHLLMRSAPCARRSFVARVMRDPKITVWPIPTRLVGVDVRAPAQVALQLQSAEMARELVVGGLVVRIGVEPALPQLDPLEQSREGYIITDAMQRTSTPGLLAAGDITAHPLRAIVCAAAAGATAALTAAEMLGVFELSQEELQALTSPRTHA